MQGKHLAVYQDYYKTLGVERSASQQEIQRAFRKLARKYHPDVSKEKGTEEKFKEINEAYEVPRRSRKAQGLRFAWCEFGAQDRNFSRRRTGKIWPGSLARAARGAKEVFTFNLAMPGNSALAIFLVLFSVEASALKDLVRARSRSSAGVEVASRAPVKANR